MNFWNLLLSCLFRCLFACLLAWFSCQQRERWDDVWMKGWARSCFQRLGVIDNSTRETECAKFMTSESSDFGVQPLEPSHIQKFNDYRSERWLPNKFGANASSRISSRFLCRWQQLDFQNRKLAIQIQKSDFSGLIAPSHCSSCR